MTRTRKHTNSFPVITRPPKKWCRKDNPIYCKLTLSAKEGQIQQTHANSNTVKGGKGRKTKVSKDRTGPASASLVSAFSPFHVTLSIQKLSSSAPNAMPLSFFLSLLSKEKQPK